MARRYIMALDQGTTGSTCIVFDENLRPFCRAYREVSCSYPSPGWVSQDPQELWEISLQTMREALQAGNLSGSDIAAIGLTNQRETTVVWEKANSHPIHEAIVWQCRRTAPLVAQYEKDGLANIVLERTGLLLDAYFSASKIAWILKGHPFARSMAERGELAFGTIDSWILWNLTGGKVHATEPSNASRTMLFNIHNLAWDEVLLKAFGIPYSLLPKVLPTVGRFGVTDKELFGAEIPIYGIAGDQQAALFGQGCFRPGDAKNTYGTGCFLMMNVGTRPVRSCHKLLTTVAWQIGDLVQYALEGSVFTAGAAIKWLRDGLGIIKEAAETEGMALSLNGNGGVYFVPAFTGMGAPYWEAQALGAIYGLNGGTNKAHIARAALEAAAYQTRDVLEAMLADSGQKLTALRVDGGMVANKFLMQFQSDLLNLKVELPSLSESTAKGAAALAGLGAGIFEVKRLSEMQDIAEVYEPHMADSERESYYQGWKKAVKHTLTLRS